MNNKSVTRKCERFVSWWIKWEDLNWPNADNLDRIKARADLIAKNDATAAVIFGTHFRWDWMPFFEILHDYFATVADELHQRGLKLYDHHSVNLVHRYDTRDEMRNVILHSQPHLPFSPSREAAATWEYNGSKLNSWHMFDTVTRKPLYYPQYTAEGFCHRNPDFIEAYCAYVKKLIADTGIDGLMDDDTVHYMFFRSCACPVCRAALQERTGMDLPLADNTEFWGNWENPAWKEWIALRFESCAIFQRAVRSVLPPDFPTMSCGGPSTTASAVFKGNEALDFLQGCNLQNLELCGNLPPYKHDPVTWNSPILHHYVSASYNASAAARTGAHCVGVGYGFTEPTANLVWALNKCLGADCWFSTLKGRLGLPSNYLATLPNDFDPIGRAYHFEKSHPELFDSTPIQQAGIYFSHETRDHSSYGCLHKGLPQDFSQTQSLLAEAGIACGTAIEIPMDTRDYQVLLVPGAELINEREIQSLRKFTIAGGKVLMFGPCGFPGANSPWSVRQKIGDDFWKITPESIDKYPQPLQWTYDEIPTPDLSKAQWSELEPGLFHHPGRLPNDALAKSLLQLVRQNLRPLPVQMEATNGYLTSFRKVSHGYVIHLLAKEYDTDIDHHLDEIRTHRSRVNIIVKAEPIDVSRIIRIHTTLSLDVFTPFQKEGASVSRFSKETLAISLPEKCPYAILHLHD